MGECKGSRPVANNAWEVNFIEEGRGERGRSICVGAIGPLVLLWLRHGC